MFEAELKFIYMRFLNPDKSLVANRVICDGNFRSFINMSKLSGHGPLRAKYKHYITVLQNTAIKTNFQMTPSEKVNPGYNRVYERFPQIRNLQLI